MKKRKLFLISCFALACQSSFSQFYSARTNLLGLATGNLNIEAAMTLNKKWSVHIPIQYNPFIYSSSKNTKFQNLTVMPGVRYWLRQSYMDKFIGVSLIGTKFHVGNILNDYRYYGYGAGIGVSYGCTYPINPRWNFEWEAGVAGMWVSCDKYVNKAAGYKYGDLHEWRILPHKISASIVYLF